MHSSNSTLVVHSYTGEGVRTINFVFSSRSIFCLLFVLYLERISAFVGESFRGERVREKHTRTHTHTQRRREDVFVKNVGFNLHEGIERSFARLERSDRLGVHDWMPFYSHKRAFLSAIDETLSSGSVGVRVSFSRFGILPCRRVVRYDYVGVDGKYDIHRMPSARLFYSTVFYANRDVVGVDVAFYVQFSGKEEKW